MPKKHRIERAGFEATGATKREAQDNLDQAIDAALTADYVPIFVLWRGTVLIGYRAPDGWHSGPPNGNGGVRVTCSHESTATRSKVESSLRYHAAQLEWDGSETCPDVLNAPAVSDDTRDDFARWAGWQSRYATAHAEIVKVTIDKQAAQNLAHGVASGSLTIECAIERARAA